MSVSNRGQFEEMYPNAACAAWEAMCPDAVDGTLTEAEQRAFDKHVAGCVHCAAELEAAQRGAAWLHMLKGHTPEPPADLMARILAGTTGAQAGAVAARPVATTEAALPGFVPELPVDDIWTRPRAVPATPSRWATVWARVAGSFRIEDTSNSFHPRFAMTAAMAFFSLALSLNLMGVRLRDIRSLDLRPGSLSRSVADAGASAERRFQNMRVVYQLESRVSELRSEDAPVDRLEQERTAPAEQAPARQPAPQPGNGQTPARQDAPAPPHGSSEVILPPADSRFGHIVARGEA